MQTKQNEITPLSHIHYHLPFPHTRRAKLSEMRTHAVFDHDELFDSKRAFDILH